jgi:L-arabinokinase
MSDILCLDDVECFLQRVEATRDTWFTDAHRLSVVRAPGRLDVMGGIADYTGALMLEATLGCGLFVAAQPRDDQMIRIHSLGDASACEAARSCVWPLSILYADNGRTTPPEQFARYFDEHDCAWAKHVAGVLYVLLESGRCSHFGGGITLMIDSSVPAGAGVSASAALKVAVCQAVTDVLGVTLPPLEAATVCQQAQYRVVGTPCGISDPITCLVGEPGTLLQMKCQPHEVLGGLPLPDGVTVVGIDSGVREEIGGKCHDTRVATFMGHRLIQEVLRQANPETQARREDNDRSDGYLANFTPTEYVERLRDRLPTKVQGLRFLECYGDTDDPLTPIKPEMTYKVRSRTEHHIYENARAHQFAERLSRANRTGSRQAVIDAGKFMYASHWSYGQRCGLSCIETDQLVNALRNEGADAGIFGAKITGSGIGGTVAVLMDDTPETHAVVERAADTYTRQSGKPARIFKGSSPGAHHFGVRQVD